VELHLHDYIIVEQLTFYVCVCVCVYIYAHIKCKLFDNYIIMQMQFHSSILAFRYGIYMYVYIYTHTYIYAISER